MFHRKRKPDILANLKAELEPLKRVEAKLIAIEGRVDRLEREVASMREEGLETREIIAKQVKSAIGQELTGPSRSLIGQLTNLAKQVGMRLPQAEKATLEGAKRTILDNLYTHGYIGGRHTPEGNAIKGIADGDLARKALDDLVREGILGQKPTQSGRHVFIDPKRVSDVKRLIEV